MIAWVNRWKDVIAPAPELPGVWRRRDGGFHIRGRATDPRTGRLREVNCVLADCRRATKAAAELEAALDLIRRGGAPTNSTGMPRFADYAVTLFERKVQTGQIASAAGREKWSAILGKHLIPRFGDWYLDKITKRDIEAWKVSVGQAGYAPTTGNTMLAVLKTILAAACDDYDGLADPAAKVAPFETKGAPHVHRRGAERVPTRGRGAIPRRDARPVARALRDGLPRDVDRAAPELAAPAAPARPAR